MPLVHLGMLHRFENEFRRIFRPMRALRGGLEPIIVIGGHENEFPAAMPGDLHRLLERAMLNLAEFALKFQ